MNGCSGGSDKPLTSPPANGAAPPPVIVLIAPPQGYWEGTITDSQSVQRSARVIATDTGEFQLYMSPFAVLGGPVNVVGFSTDWLVAYGDRCCGTASLPVTTLQIGGLVNPGEIANTALEGQTFRGEITSGSNRYAFNVTTQSAANPLTLDALAGTYTGSTAAYQTTPMAWTLTIETTGRITGSDDYGCQWTGTASVSRANVFKLAMSASGCAANPLAPKNGNYIALGRQRDAHPAHPLYPGQTTIEFATFGPAWLGYRTFAR